MCISSPLLCLMLSNKPVSCIATLAVGSTFKQKYYAFGGIYVSSAIIGAREKVRRLIKEGYSGFSVIME